jgi:hypothetical protein
MATRARLGKDALHVLGSGPRRLLPRQVKSDETSANTQ